MIREKLYWVDAAFRIESLTVYTNIQKDPVVTELYELTKLLAASPQAKETSLSYYKFLSFLTNAAERLKLKGNIFSRYMIYLFLTDENPYSLACEKERSAPSGTISVMALKDIVSLKFFIDMDVKNICDNIGYKDNLTDYIPVYESDNSIFDRIESAQKHEEILELLTKYYAKTGCGIIGRSKVLTVAEHEGTLRFEAVNNPDPVLMGDIIGIDYPKQIILNNTRSFISRGQSDNILLAGCHGTGKSSCVKALPALFYDSRLRLITLVKSQVSMIPVLMNVLTGRGLFFIIYIGDINVDDIRRDYAYYKPLLYSGVEKKPDNILLYASSNTERCYPDLSEYFGITLDFVTFTEEEYINVVRTLVKKSRINVPDDFLNEQAKDFAKKHQRLTGKVAKQFVKNIFWELNNN